MVDGRSELGMRRLARLSELAQIIKTQVIGDDIEIDGLNLSNRQTKYTKVLSYAMGERYLLMAAENEAIAAMVLSQELADYAKANMKGRFSVLVSSSPEVDFYKIHTHLYHNTDFYDNFEFPASIGNNPNIHPTAIVEDGVIIGDNVIVEAYAVIKHGSVLGDNVYIGCHVVIGEEGFQIIKDGRKNMRIVHAGGCHISDGSAIHKGTAVCNSLFEGATYIGENVMIDGMSYVEHNCCVEANAVLTPSVTLCGSVNIRQGAWIGAGATVLNQVTVGKNATLGIGCVAISDIPDGATAVGNPARVLEK